MNKEDFLKNKDKYIPLLIIFALLFLCIVLLGYSNKMIERHNIVVDDLHECIEKLYEYDPMLKPDNQPKYEWMVYFNISEVNDSEETS